MNNSTLITGALAFGFILFLAARNRLTAYASVLGLVPAPVSGSTGGGSGGATSPPSPKSTPPAAGGANAPASPAASITPFETLQHALTAGAPQTLSTALQSAASMAAPAGLLGF